MESLFNKIAGPGLHTCNFIKERLQHGCFPVKFTRFLRTTFFTEHLRWLLVKSIRFSYPLVESKILIEYRSRYCVPQITIVPTNIGIPFDLHRKKLPSSLTKVKACNFTKRRLRDRYFPVKIANFLRILFFTEHLRWLLLKSFTIFTGKPLCWSLFLLKFQASGLELY